MRLDDFPLIDSVDDLLEMQCSNAKSTIIMAHTGACKRPLRSTVAWTVLAKARRARFSERTVSQDQERFVSGCGMSEAPEKCGTPRR